MSLRVACTRGKGTWTESANVFERAILRLSTFYSVPIDLWASSQTYNSCPPPPKYYDDRGNGEGKTSQDALLYEIFLRLQAAQGTRVIFQTAVDTQTLHLAGQSLQAAKIECFDQGSKSLLLVRDQSQGSHNDLNDISPGTAPDSCRINKELTNRLIALSIDRARQLWGDDADTSISLVCHSHPFDCAFSAWAEEWSRKSGVEIEMLNAEMASSNLLAFGIQGRQIMIAGNDCVDTVTDILDKIIDPDDQKSKCTETVYLHPDVYPLSEYQVLHDDPTGKEVVDPVPTIRTAASILARHAGCRGIEAAMDLALSSLRRRGFFASDDDNDVGGADSTTPMNVVECILDAVMAAALAPGYMGLLQTLRASPVVPCRCQRAWA